MASAPSHRPARAVAHRHPLAVLRFQNIHQGEGRPGLGRNSPRRPQLRGGPAAPRESGVRARGPLGPACGSRSTVRAVLLVRPQLPSSLPRTQTTRSRTDGRVRVRRRRLSRRDGIPRAAEASGRGADLAAVLDGLEFFSKDFRGRLFIDRSSFCIYNKTVRKLSEETRVTTPFYNLDSN